ETEYVSTRLAWERLEEALRKRLEHSFAWHDYAHSRGKIASDLASPEERAALPPQCWRTAWKNPVDGRRALYNASHAYAIRGLGAGGRGAGGGPKVARRPDGCRARTGAQLRAQRA